MGSFLFFKILIGVIFMANFNIPQELIDRLATAEVQALLEGLEDEEQRRNPAFLAKVRQFLKDNDFNTTIEIEGVKEVKQEASKIPDFMELVKEG
ncbi:hypothetical protein [Megasphaera massiliensis]|uniref:hypothetical protein n=1 Tax=Megasphaera massiliensis TaxID=1232428 RepID=UPI0036F2BFA4